MKCIMIGCGRVGAALALTLSDDGWDVIVVELKEENLGRLGPEWRHPLVLGHGMDVKVLEKAGIQDADVLIAATDGDNTNLVVAQVAVERYHVPHVEVKTDFQSPALAGRLNHSPDITFHGTGGWPGSLFVLDRLGVVDGDRGFFDPEADTVLDLDGHGRLLDLDDPSMDAADGYDLLALLQRLAEFFLVL